MLEHFDLRSCAKSEKSRGNCTARSGIAGAIIGHLKASAAEGPVLRFNRHDHALVIKLHHLVTDGWSQRLFWGELESLYRASQLVPTRCSPSFRCNIVTSLSGSENG